MWGQGRGKAVRVVLALAAVNSLIGAGCRSAEHQELHDEETTKQAGTTTQGTNAPDTAKRSLISSEPSSKVAAQAAETEQAVSALLPDLPSHPPKLPRTNLRVPVAQASKENNVGIVIGEPVVSGDTALASFGAGCGRWLQFTVGGQGAAGRSPLWPNIERARRELGRPDFQLTAQDAPKLVSMLGITHVALGGMKGAAGQWSLTYRMVSVPDGKAVGQPVTVSGSDAQIVAALPELARKLCRALGVASPTIPAKLDATPDDVRLIGGIPWFPVDDLPSAQTHSLLTLAEKLPLAGMLALKPLMLQATGEPNKLIKFLLTQSPENTLAYSQIGWDDAKKLLPYQAQIKGLVRKYPKNYPLAMTNVWLLRTQNKIQEALTESERMVQINPNNPDIWLTYGYSTAEIAHNLRKGRFYGQLSAAESAQLQDIYPRWEQAVVHAVEIDPRHAKGWSRVAEAATFSGDQRLATQAYWEGVRLDKTNPDAYDWGLQMFQPKWGGDTNALRKVAEAYSAVCNYDMRSLAAVRALTDSKLEADAQRLAARILDENRKKIQNNPGEADAPLLLARMLNEQKNYVEAEEAIKPLLQRDPNNAEAHLLLGLIAQQRGATPRALKEFREAARLAPNSAQAHYELGWELKHAGMVAEAEPELKTALTLRPDFDNAHFTLGEVYLMTQRPTDGIREIRQAVQIAPGFWEAYRTLCIALAQQKQYKEAVEAGKQAVQIKPNDLENLMALGYAYGVSNQFH